MKSYKQAFTLIELLVVIAIIAILAAILFPVFAQAKNSAKASVSLSNVKQVNLGVLMYLGDSDDVYPQSEYGGNSATVPHVMWMATVYPYTKSGGQRASLAGSAQVNFGTAGVFRSPAYPKQPIANPRNDEEAQAGGMSYGVHHGVFVNNYGNRGQAQPNQAVSAALIEDPATKVMLAEKGANHANWSYPWFHDWQNYWVGRICRVQGDASTCDRDGVDVYEGGARFDPRFDSDCNSRTNGNWECAAHPRYRFNGSAPFAMFDGSAKSIRKGGVKWFAQIWFDRRSLYNGYEWYYAYARGEWGPYIY